MLKRVQCATIKMFQLKTSFASSHEYTKNGNFGGCFFVWLGFLFSLPCYWVPNGLDVTALKFWVLAVLTVPYCQVILLLQ